MIPKTKLSNLVSLKQEVEYGEKSYLEKTFNKNFNPEIKMKTLMITSEATNTPIHQINEINQTYQQLHKHIYQYIEATKHNHKNEAQEHQKKITTLTLQLKTKLIENQHTITKFNQETTTINTDDENKTHYYDKMCIGYLCVDK
jgi:hypothetical protein